MAQKQTKIKEVEIEDDEMDSENMGEALLPSKADDYQMVMPGQEVEAVVVSVGEIEMFHHEKFGDKPFVSIGVEFSGIEQEMKLFLPRNKMIRPNSTAGKLFKACKVNKLSALVGKKILLRANKDGYMRFAEEYD